MIVRFCLYSILKNLRFADPFLVLFLLHLEYSYAEIGALLGMQHLLTGVLEVPLGWFADRWGRRRSLAGCFLFYALSFSCFAAFASESLAGLSGALISFGIAEALRSGSHKAIILDYLDGRGEGARATEVIGFTRAFSKGTSAIAALAGGALLYFSRDYALLFALSAVPAFAGVGLMLSYPRDLDGEQHRARADGAKPPPLLDIAAARRLLARPRIRGLLLQSVCFESQVKLLLKVYLQPFLKQGLASAGIPVLGTGALWIGGLEFARDQAGAVSAFFAPRAEARFGGAARSLGRAYIGLGLAAVGVGVCAYWEFLIPGVLLLVGVTVLQNLRRPIFVSAFNEVIDKPQRATSLSLESLARSVLVAATLPVVGQIADAFGLWSAFAAICAVLAAGALAVAAVQGREAVDVQSRSND